MNLMLKGEIMRKGVSKAGKPYVQLIYGNGDGSKGVCVVMTPKADTYKVGQQVELKVDTFLRVVNEVV